MFSYVSVASERTTSVRECVRLVATTAATVAAIVLDVSSTSERRRLTCECLL